MNTSFDTLATTESVTKTSAALAANGFLPEVVETKEAALARIREIIPTGASVMNGSSRTLEEIGFIEVLKTRDHPWNNLHDAILAETDPAKQAILRTQSVISDVYLGSAHAVTENGEIVVFSASGSQLPHLVFTSNTIILVVSTQKIVSTLDEARRRVAEYVFPLEDARAKSIGYGGSLMGKELVMHREHPHMNRKVHVIFVNEKLGF